MSKDKNVVNDSAWKQKTPTSSRHIYCGSSVSQTNSIIDDRKPVNN
jgi:hypothetical protein